MEHMVNVPNCCCEDCNISRADSKSDKGLMRDENALLRAVLGAVEWHGDIVQWDGTRDHQCPWCGAAEEDGHKYDCQRQRALEGK